MVDRMTGSEDLRDIETKTKQDNGILEQFLGTKGQTRIQLFIRREKGMEKHAYENRKNGRTNNREESS